ncbi:hypothetical protein [Plesiomonas shigelloides]|uniref:hypothetical protein n=1 Tax=Plesiomonas shigelloides TaxID=703 RepID=UPI001E456177|nr:hypothetical protein [Plesiomonas shigelloides]
MASKRKKRACKCSCKKNGRSSKNSHSSVDLSGHEPKGATLFSKLDGLLNLLIKIKIVADHYDSVEVRGAIKALVSLLAL